MDRNAVRTMVADLVRQPCASVSGGATCILVLIMSLLAADVHAQEDALVILETNLPEAIVYADTARLGPARYHRFNIAPGRVRLQLAPPSILNWSIAPVDTTLDLQPRDTVELRLDFPYHYRIETTPFGAPVYHIDGAERRRLGSTPLFYTSDEPLQGTFLIDMPGYRVAEFEPAERVWNVHAHTLHAVAPGMGGTGEVAWEPPSRKRWWIDAVAVGSALAATGVSVYYKFRADDMAETYLEDCRSPAQGSQCTLEVRDRIRRFDRVAGVSLGVAQVGLGVFAIRLVLQ